MSGGQMMSSGGDMGKRMGCDIPVEGLLALPKSLDLKVSTQKVSVPCTRNIYKQYKVKIPRTVKEKIPKTVNYTTMETRKRQVPYTVNKQVVNYTTMETRKRQVP